VLISINLITTTSLPLRHYYVIITTSLPLLLDQVVCIYLSLQSIITFHRSVVNPSQMGGLLSGPSIPLASYHIAKTLYPDWNGMISNRGYKCASTDTTLLVFITQPQVLSTCYKTVG
jgi:hypothetical protein